MRTNLGNLDSLSPMISSVVWANQGAILMVLPSGFPTVSCNLLDSYDMGSTPVAISTPRMNVTTHLCSFAPEDRIELTQLGWSKPGVNNPFLSMMVHS